MHTIERILTRQITYRFPEKIFVPVISISGNLKLITSALRNRERGANFAHRSKTNNLFTSYFYFSQFIKHYFHGFCCCNFARIFHLYSFSQANFSKERRPITFLPYWSYYEKGSVFTFQVIMHHQYLFRARRDELLPSVVHKSETCLWNAAYPDPQLNWKRDSCLRARNLQVGSVSESVIEYIQKRLIAPAAVGRKTIEASNVALASLQQMR